MTHTYKLDKILNANLLRLVNALWRRGREIRASGVLLVNFHFPSSPTTYRWHSYLVVSSWENRRTRLPFLHYFKPYLPVSRQWGGPIRRQPPHYLLNYHFVAAVVPGAHLFGYLRCLSWGCCAESCQDRDLQVSFRRFLMMRRLIWGNLRVKGLRYLLFYPSLILWLFCFVNVEKHSSFFFSKLRIDWLRLYPNLTESYYN